MADSRDKRAAEIQDAIRQILYRKWDPIGFCDAGSEDEYDAYIGGVYRILAASRSEDALINFLRETEVGILGSGAPPRDRLRPIAQKLLALDVRL